jgi:large subunit ribosomal protein L22
MDVQAVTKYVRISPQKANEVARLIRGLRAAEALDTLRFSPRKGARIIRKTLQSAIANAEKNAELNVNDLVVKTAVVGTGPQIKRWLAVARGSMHPIIKRTSHVKIVLSDDGAAKRTKAAARPKAARPAPPSAEQPKPEAGAEPAKKEEQKA